MSGAIVTVLPHVPNVPQFEKDLQHYVYNMLQILGGLFRLVLHPVYSVPQIRQYIMLQTVGRLFYSAWGVANEVLPNLWYLQCAFLSITSMFCWWLHWFAKCQVFLIKTVCLLKLKLWINKY